MVTLRISVRHVVVTLVLASLVALGFTLVATAQDAAPGEPAGPAPESVEVYEEELVGRETQPRQPDPVAAPGEPDLGPNSVSRVEEVELLPGSSSPERAQFFKFLSANTFVPYDDDMTYNYHGAGCVYRTGGTSFSEHDLQLPDGAEIDFLRVYFYDNDAANNAAAHLFAFDAAGGFTSIASAASSGTPGQSSSGSGFFSYIVDNVSRALSLRLDYGGGTNSNLRICGVRLRYQYTVARLSLPAILNQTNP